MHWLDWVIVAAFLGLNIGIGIFFSRRSGKNMDAFFVSGRSLKWYIAGASMIATSFASDTPLWVGTCVRESGLHAVWRYWTPLIGCALGVALFSRVWRRTRVVTDNEMLELRYTGKGAEVLRGITAGAGAILFCPLIIGWVCKAMITIAKEALGVTEATPAILGMNAEVAVTVGVMACAVIVSTCGGLMGAAYSDFVQFLLATIGAFILAWLAIKHVGGLESMVEQLQGNEDWVGREMNIAPRISTEITAKGEPGMMSIWNVIGFFGILWWGNALCGGYQAQRLLACKDTRHASNALLMFTLIYFAVICWPWIAVALSSIIAFPALGTEGHAGHDAAYPKMMLKVLPLGLKGIMMGTMIAAFTSTVQTMFNWGSSYIVNDLYRRFAVKEGSDHHYVRVSRVVTVIVAVAGGVIAFNAKDILSLLNIFFVVLPITAVTGIMRWLWWRLTVQGEIAAFIVNYVAGILLLFGHKIFGLATPLFDRPLGWLFRLPADVSFTTHGDLLGARMLLMMVISATIAIAVSLCTAPTDRNHLCEFVKRTRIHCLGWGPVVRDIQGYQPAHTIHQILLDWVLVMATCCSLVFTFANFIRLRMLEAGGMLLLFIVLLLWVLRRTRKELHDDEAD